MLAGRARARQTPAERASRELQARMEQAPPPVHARSRRMSRTRSTRSCRAASSPIRRSAIQTTERAGARDLDALDDAGDADSRQPRRQPRMIAAGVRGAWPSLLVGGTLVGCQHVAPPPAKQHDPVSVRDRRLPERHRRSRRSIARSSRCSSSRSRAPASSARTIAAASAARSASRPPETARRDGGARARGQAGTRRRALRLRSSSRAAATGCRSRRRRR